MFSLQDATLEHSNLEVIWKRTTFCYIWLRLGKKMADRAKIRIRPVRIFGKSDDRKFRISAHRRESNEICRIIWSSHLLHLTKAFRLLHQNNQFPQPIESSYCLRLIKSSKFCLKTFVIEINWSKLSKKFYINQKVLS